MTAAARDPMMMRFAADYLALLDQRVVTIQAQLSAGDQMTAQVAMLSLESASTMVGAVDLARAVGRLRAALESGEAFRLGELSREMATVAQRVPTLLAGL